MRIRKKLNAELIAMLERFSFVRWDRFVPDDGDYSFYGWIDREDEYKDFLVLEYIETTSRRKAYWHFITSSALRHKEILEIMQLTDAETNACRRVEDHFDIDNSIKLWD